MGGRGTRSLSFLVAATLVLASGCRGPAPQGLATNTVRAVMSNDPSSLSFIGKSDRNSEIFARLVSDCLVEYDENLVLKPRVAESWDVSPDGLTVTFHLRRNVKWHDGEPVTARDVVFTILKVKDPAIESRRYRTQFEDVESIEALDDQTLRVRYASPYADFLEAWRVPLVPEHLLSGEKDFLGSKFARHPVGCGPFRFVRWEPGREIVLEANPDYWEGPPKLAGLVLRILPSDRTGYQALLRGEIDVMGVTPDLWREAQASPRATRLARFTYTPMSVWYIGWNVDGSNPFFNDPRTRRAMTLALDRERFISKVLGGLARPAVGTYPPEIAQEDPALAPWPYDPREASRLLDEVGWKDADGDGVRERGGRPFSFVVIHPAGTQELADRIAAWVQQSLASIGVRMEIEKLEWRAFQERRRAHQFQAAMASIWFTPVPDQYELYHSASRDIGLNYSGLADPEVDRMIEEGRRTFDPAARREIYTKLRRKIHQLEPASFLFHFTAPVLYDVRLEGLRPCRLGLFEFVPGPRSWRWAGVAQEG